MRRLGLLGPSTLLGKEVREQLGQRSLPLEEIRMLAATEDELGAVVDVGRRPALIEAAELERIADLDLLVSTADPATTRSALSSLAPAATAVLVQFPGEGVPIVAGVNSELALTGERLISPHPAVIAVAHMMAPLQSLHPVNTIATVLEPASHHGQRGLDEILDQSRALLSFQEREPQSPYPWQMAFNLLPSSDDPAPAGHLAAVLGLEDGVSLQFLQAGVFHSVSISLHCRFAEPTSAERLRDLVSASPMLEIASEPAGVGPVAGAGKVKVQVGNITASGEQGGYWFWLVCDNLMQGGAWNAVDIVADLLRNTGPETAN